MITTQRSSIIMTTALGDLPTQCREAEGRGGLPTLQPRNCFPNMICHFSCSWKASERGGIVLLKLFLVPSYQCTLERVEWNFPGEASVNLVFACPAKQVVTTPRR
jgi:hypothetical protein